MALATDARETVVLLHGLARTARSMSRLEQALTSAGYAVCNVSYPSRVFRVERLVADYIVPAVRACSAGSVAPVHFVTHSLGGILVRQLAATEASLRIGRVVMLAPPNGGSEVVDKLGSSPLLKQVFRWVNGPAGGQLGTGANDLPRALGAATFEVGVIAGRRSVNLWLSTLIVGDDDGKVSVENTRLAGMKDFLVLPVSHPFVMRNGEAIAQTIRFLADGRFAHHSANAP